ncbi:hypothetical protein UlMin_021203 [Ulmus minor]
MDNSSYTHSQPDPNQYHQYYPQQPQEQQQFQAYDQSSQPYYSYNHLPHYDHQYQYYHSPQDYSNSYPQQSQPQFHPDPNSIHPPGVPIPPLEPPQSVQSEQNQQNSYPPHGAAVHQHQLGSGQAGGLNPAAAAAVAAFSQLSQFAGDMDAAQRAMHPPIGKTPYRGGGRRGGRPFRGGRGHSGYHVPKPNGSAPSFRGRGRGQGGGRHLQSGGAVSTNFNSASVQAEGPAALMQQPSALVPGQAPIPAPAEVPIGPFWRPPQMAWCELCRVDCNTHEILEQHKNGKRHKKNLKVFEELQKRNKVTAGQQNAQMPYAGQLNAQMPNTTESKPDVSEPEKVDGEQPLLEKPSEVVTNDHGNETELQCGAMENSEASAKPESQMDQSARGRGSKRKMNRGGRGGKYIRTHAGSRRLVEPPKPKQVIPFICELCNVKCESQVVFDTHLIGKKHIANVKRFQGHRALYGDAGLQALYTPNFTAPSTSLNPQVQQGVDDPQVLLAQLLFTVISQAQASGMAGPASTLPPSSALPGSSIENQNQPTSQVQGSEATSEGNQNTVIAETKSELQTVSIQSEAPSVGDTDTKTENGTPEVEGQEVHISDKTLSSEQCGVSGDLVVEPEEPKNDEPAQ